MYDRNQNSSSMNKTKGICITLTTPSIHLHCFMTTGAEEVLAGAMIFPYEAYDT